MITKTEINLVDPKIPETAQPYHEVMELPWEESERAVQKFARAIERVAIKTLAQLIKQQKSDGKKVCAVGIVGAPNRDLARIGNYHIRAHAAEGVLFRRVLDDAARANGLPFRAFAEREFAGVLERELGSRSIFVKKRLDVAARGLPPPWRADDKLAAMAAWLVLHNDRA